jgi:NADPH:quinone reductase-like Zn-dependent oxidoreductase
VRIDGLSASHLKPVIAKTFPLEQIVEAHRYLETNQQIGKIVVTVWRGRDGIFGII